MLPNFLPKEAEDTPGITSAHMLSLLAANSIKLFELVFKHVKIINLFIEAKSLVFE